MRKALLLAVITACTPNTVFAISEIELLRQQLNEIKNNYEQRIQTLEKKLQQAE